MILIERIARASISTSVRVGIRAMQPQSQSPSPVMQLVVRCVVQAHIATIGNANVTPAFCPRSSSRPHSPVVRRT